MSEHRAILTQIWDTADPLLSCICYIHGPDTEGSVRICSGIDVETASMIYDYK